MTAPTRPEVGTLVQINEIGDSLPVGTVVRDDNGNERVKLQSGLWGRPGYDDDETESQRLVLRRRIVSYPTERPAVGDTVNISEVNDQLPIGTRVHFADTASPDRQTRYTKTSETHWTSGTGHAAQVRNYTRRVVIDSYPDEQVEVEQAEQVERNYRIYTADTILTPEEADHLPPGTTVRDQNGNGEVHTREAADWRYENGRQCHHSEIMRVARAGGLRVQSLPRVTQELWDTAPEGSMFLYALAPSGASRHLHPNIKCADGWYANGERQEQSRYELADYTLVWWGDGQNVEAVEQSVSTFTLGNRVTAQNIDLLPIGTVIGASDTATRYRKTSAGNWARVGGGDLPHQHTFSLDSRIYTYNIYELPAQDARQPVVPVGPQVGDLMNPNLMNSMPVGTRLAHRSNNLSYIKLGNQEWQRSDGHAYPPNMFNSVDYTITHIPETVPSTVAPVLDEMRQRIRDCIDECVRQHSPTSGHVRDGAWIKLGFEPVPERGVSIPARTAYGLPNHSLIEQRGHLFRVDDQRGWPERFSPSGTAHNVNIDIESDVTVIWTPETEAPIFYSGLDLLHKFWNIYRKMRPLHRWCDYVDGRLRGCDLNDPGEQPQQFTAVEPEPYVIEVGPLDTRQDPRAYAAFRGLPEGSLCHSTVGTYVKRTDGWMDLTTLLAVWPHEGRAYADVTIDYIPAQIATTEWDERF